MSATEREALDAGTVWWDGELFTGGPGLAKTHVGKGADAQRRLSRPFSTARAKTCARCSMIGTSRTCGPTCRPRFGLSSSRNGFFAMIIPQALRRPGILGVCAFLRAGQDRLALRHGVLDHRGAEFPGPGGTAAALRYRRAKESFPAAPRARRGSAVLRTHRSRAPAPMRPPFPTPASSARAAGRARTSSASSSISPSATLRWRRSPRWSDWRSACSIPSG